MRKLWVCMGNDHVEAGKRTDRLDHSIEDVSASPSFGVLHYAKPLGIFDADALAFSSREAADAVCVEGVELSKSESAPTTTFFPIGSSPL